MFPQPQHPLKSPSSGSHLIPYMDGPGRCIRASRAHCGRVQQLFFLSLDVFFECRLLFLEGTAHV